MSPRVSFSFENKVISKYDAEQCIFQHFCRVSQGKTTQTTHFDGITWLAMCISEGSNMSGQDMNNIFFLPRVDMFSFLNR